MASKHVVLTGQTAPGATVVLRKTLASGKLRKVARTHADAQGTYRFTINCGMGTTPFTAEVAGAGGGASSAILSVTRANQAIVWNSIALQAVRNADMQAPDSSRDLAIVALSVYDAVNAIDPKYAMYGGVTATVSRGPPPTPRRRRGGDRPGRPLPQSVGHAQGGAERHAGGDPRRAGPQSRGRAGHVGREPDPRPAEQRRLQREGQLRPGHGAGRLGADSSGLRPGRRPAVG